ncbi:hypothetical protein [Paenibacillus ihuae]|uniref:hypothetical protein n=1 Tax=Paenibacillus ihuae TaxID=1232431 RepID=UPI0011DCDF93|nr:hypothetical protein [Paenibacillus ihuae]
MMTYKYQTPILLEQLRSWQMEIASEVPYLEPPTGLYLGIDRSDTGYFCTPVDAVGFARTGSDGEHFAFLSDFGTTMSLAEAPVIRVMPMESQHTRLVARNLFDFFCLHFYDELLLLGEYSSEEEYLESVQEQAARQESTEWFDLDRWRREQAQVTAWAAEQFHFAPIPQAWQYQQELRAERERNVRVATNDTLGVLALNGQTGIISAEIPDHLTDEEDLEELQVYFRTAEKEVKLAFIRNMQHDASSDPLLVEWCAGQLTEMGMPEEAENLRVRLLN